MESKACLSLKNCPLKCKDDFYLSLKCLFNYYCIGIFFFRLEETSLNPIKLTDILEESSQHLNRIYISLVTNTNALKKTSKIVDSVLYRDKYASDVAICSLNEITNILNSMETALHTKIKVNKKYL